MEPLRYEVLGLIEGENPTLQKCKTTGEHIISKIKNFVDTFIMDLENKSNEKTTFFPINNISLLQINKYSLDLQQIIIHNRYVEKLQHRIYNPSNYSLDYFCRPVYRSRWIDSELWVQYI